MLLSLFRSMIIWWFGCMKCYIFVFHVAQRILAKVMMECVSHPNRQGKREKKMTQPTESKEKFYHIWYAFRAFPTAPLLLQFTAFPFQINWQSVCHSELTDDEIMMEFFSHWYKYFYAHAPPVRLWHIKLVRTIMWQIFKCSFTIIIVHFPCQLSVYFHESF